MINSDNHEVRRLEISDRMIELDALTGDDFTDDLQKGKRRASNGAQDHWSPQADVSESRRGGGGSCASGQRQRRRARAPGVGAALQLAKFPNRSVNRPRS